MKKKKILIVSIKAGYGHHSTGQALVDYFEEKGCICSMLDTFDYINPILGDSIQDSYVLITKFLPEAFGKIYGKLDKKDTKYNKYSLVSILSNLVSKQLRDFITQFAPDAVIGTHSYACMVMTYLKEKGYLNCPTLGIVTDFTVHPFWESTDIDYYITPDRLLNLQMTKKGIPEEKVLPYGIPIKQKFSVSLPKQEAREILGIQDKQTILVMMGSMGYGNIDEQLKSLDAVDGDFQILCVCGNNEKIYKSISKHQWTKTLYPYGFVDNVDVMMDAADCIITKPGGLTTSEAMAKGLPIILMHPIPGQEDRNMEFLINNGSAVMVTDTFPLDEAIYEIFHNDWHLRLMRESISHLGKPYATKDVGEFVMKLMEQPSEKDG